ncbi:DUF692 domain-containing protein [Streptomyces parvulus]|uniref:DUF692 domain-containing protein n=1 Tax=Streptomyces parvulus TaxID=146923 RepID=UPI0036A51442
MSPDPLKSLPELGVGLGYRDELHDDIVTCRDEIDWLEIVTDRYLLDPKQEVLRRLREDFVLVAHGLDMSIGSDAPLDLDYLEGVAAVADSVGAPWVSDHLCFTREHGVELHTLAPVFRTPERARTIAARAQAVQDRLARPFLLENITYYLDPPGAMSEPEFISAIMERCDCGLLLDLNNVAVNSANHGFDPYAYVDALPLDRVVQVHLAGAAPVAHDGMPVIDGHDWAVTDQVFNLLEYVASRHQLKGAMIERDQNFPSDFGELSDELRRTRTALAAGVEARSVS